MTRADIILLLIAVLALPFVYLHYWQATTAGTSVRIMRGETLVRELALNKDQEINIDGPLGTSRLQIQNGKIRFIASPCSARVCIHKGWLSHSGDFNACLPNRISIEIMGPGEYDSINF
ncbi:MAG TPA: NusG domain II-containing protein [Gammaproteobacteria bacterium]|nr:NusG domain II-containing protein [Gammaproteobacteria bacterium]